ncbi:Hypothetical protein LUCI_0406 [Lucifera butyrica]|uniref:Uncharacterized protein n=1 Tax=Lucifera butyrica TaxID=1351585 RepID=A0A498R213_9FIRM|nr:hypothetical protein [Lucifera butyrica]VBB05199.1 Hypothetical protein LUCI_0406 [Lucifera butyrica]
MKIWDWFCRLGTKDEKEMNSEFWRRKRVQTSGSANTEAADGTEMFCTRMCGGRCQCGSTVRGIHCIWSYYRKM